MNYYFLGIGGIGMSALARYFKHGGFFVSGYDRTVSPLTRELEAEGISVVYDDQVEAELLRIRDMNPEDTMVVRTPAVPEDQPIYSWFSANGFTILKRSEVLGQVTRQKKALCVAGTHGKTTTSTMLAHIMESRGVNAFLGGISNNYATNLLLDSNSDYVVVEADEYDRSFHHLSPYMSVITSIDPDHLDIYGSAEAYQEGFDVYAGKVAEAIVLKHGYNIKPCGAKVYTYSINEGDFHARNIRVGEGRIVFDFVTPAETVSDINLGVPVWVNIENSIAAMAVAWLNGIKADVLRERMASYRGVYRRFDIHIRRDNLVYIDDYAHHPTELRASMESVRRLYPNRRFIAVFQPHLYTRTRDFMTEFTKVLSTADEVLLLPIYPARELPIPGVTSEALGFPVVQKSDLIDVLRRRVQELTSAGEKIVLMTLGAGDIDRLVPQISDKL